ICGYAKTQQQVLNGMYTSIDANNEPNSGQTNVTYNFEGTLADYTDGAPRGAFSGTGLIRFTQVYNNSAELPAPSDRWDAGSFSNGFWNKYSDLAFGSAPTTVNDSINYSQSLTISDINVFVAINHTYANDINISLRNPAGSTTRILYPGAGADVGMHMITLFDDQADSTIGGSTRAPWSPRVRPTNTLSTFNGQSAQGYWRLTVTDIFPGADNGVLIGWGLQFNNQTVVGIEPGVTEIPLRYELHQNYPNPFNPTTTIKYSIAGNQHVKIAVFDILGREVQVLVNEYKKTGSYSLLLNATGMASGVYFYTIKAGDFTDTKKMLLLK
ncbi:MAG: T9SS type A sorting domain-containing protein, partial [Ignavibacteria bacterium]